MMAETAGVMKSAGTVGPPNIPRLPSVKPSLSHAPWLQQPPASGLVPGGVPGGTGHLVHPGTSLLCVLSSSAAAEPDGAAGSAELGDTAPSPPAAVGSPGRAGPAAFPEQMAAAWGGWRQLRASFLSFMHTQRDSRRLRLRREVPLGPALAVHFTRVQRA